MTKVGVLLALAVAVTYLWSPSNVSAQSAADCSQTVLVQSGDTLSTIAGQYLGSSQAYSRIVAATNAAIAVDPSYSAINDVNVIGIGWKLCIPGDAAQTAPVATASVQSAPVAPVTDSDIPLTIDDIAAYLEILQRRMGEDGVHPLTIQYLRNQSYPATPIVVEELLESGSNYSRYLVSYRSEGLKIYAYMTIPIGVAPATGWPVVVFNHGYVPPEIYRSTERYIAYTDAFARNGYIVFRPDYRGHGFSEGDSRGSYGLPDYTIDVLNALSAIKAYPVTDPNRIGMWGHSMGGYITMRAMVTTQDIQAGVIWAGVIASYPDILDRWTRPSSVNNSVPRRATNWRTALTALFGTPETNAEFWNSISANSYVTDLSGPLQLHHGTGDTSVPVEFSTLVNAEVQAIGGSVEYYTYAGDDHNISANFETAMARSVAFFDTYVKNRQPVPQSQATQLQ